MKPAYGGAKGVPPQDLVDKLRPPLLLAVSPSTPSQNQPSQTQVCGWDLRHLLQITTEGCKYPSGCRYRHVTSLGEMSAAEAKAAINTQVTQEAVKTKALEKIQDSLAAFNHL